MQLWRFLKETVADLLHRWRQSRLPKDKPYQASRSWIEVERKINDALKDKCSD